QYLVLRDATAQPALLLPRDTPGLIGSLATAGALSSQEADALEAVHATFVAEGLACTLDRRPRLVVENAGLATARAVVMRTTTAHGLAFDPL
ncbi:MAG: glutamate-ammonia ligase adenylyltransferase, partial [Rhodovulum sulfidophilum]